MAITKKISLEYMQKESEGNQNISTYVYYKKN